MPRSCRIRRRPACRARRRVPHRRPGFAVVTAAAVRVLVRAGSALAVLGTLHQAVNLRGLRRPPVDPPPVTEPVTVALPVRDEAHRVASDPARAARPARRRRPRDPRPGRRLDRRHRPTSSGAWPAATPGCGSCAARPPPRGLPGQAARLRPARGRGPRERAGVRRRRRGAGAARGRGRGRGAARRRARPALARSRASSPTAPPGWCSRCCSGRGWCRCRCAGPSGPRGRRCAPPTASSSSSTPRRWRRAGGFAGVAAEVLDDIALARAVKRSGGRVGVADGADLAACRMYDGWADLRRRLPQVAVGGVRARPGAAAVAGALALAYLVPPLAALRGSRAGLVGYAAAVVGRVLAAAPQRRPRVARRAGPPACRSRRCSGCSRRRGAGTGGAS